MSKVEPIPISEKTWEIIQQDPKFKEHRQEMKAGVTLHFITCTLFDKLLSPVPVYINPKFEENE